MPVPPVIQMYRYVMGSGGGLGNLLKASEEFQQTVDWVRYPTSSQTPTVNADSRPDPNGGTTADQVDYTANTGARLMQTVTLKASTQYTFSVHARAVSGTVDFRMRNITLKAAVQKTATTTGPLTNGFTRFTYTFTTGAAGSYELALQNASGTPTARSVIFWGAMLNQGGTALDYDYAAPTTGGSAPAPAYAGFGDSFGGVTAYYSLRQFTEAETLNAIRVRRSSDDTEQDIGFDANGDLDTTALTTFVGSENLFFPSETFTGWGNIGGSTITSNTTDTNDPFGGSNATKVVAGSSVLIYKGAFTNVVRTQTFYAKAGTCETFGMYFGSGFSANFNISESSPSVTSTNNTSATITDVGNGWYRCTATLTSLPASDYYAGINFSPSSGSTFYIFGAQLEGGTTATTYNPTTTGIGGDGAVTTFYDQTGNGNNATNSTASEQPLVVSGGTLVEENGKAAIDFDGTDDYLAKIATLTINGDHMISAVHTPQGVGGYLFSLGYNDPQSVLLATEVANYSRYWLNAAADQLNSGETVSGQRLTTGEMSSGSQTLYIDGSQNSTKSTTYSGGDVPDITIGYAVQRAQGSNYLVGKVQELIFFNSDQSTNRTGIETNINDHFSIYP